MTPGNWKICKISGSEVGEPYYRLLCSWYGSYTTGDSWKMSSGVTKIYDKVTYYEIHNVSKSIYACFKNCEGFSVYGSSIYSSYTKQNSDALKIEALDMGDLLKDPLFVDSYCY